MSCLYIVQPGYHRGIPDKHRYCRLDNLDLMIFHCTYCITKYFGIIKIKIKNTSKIPVRWPGQCYGFTLSLIYKYCGGI